MVFILELNVNQRDTIDEKRNIKSSILTVLFFILKRLVLVDYLINAGAAGNLLIV